MDDIQQYEDELKRNNIRFHQYTGNENLFEINWVFCKMSMSYIVCHGDNFLQVDKVGIVSPIVSISANIFM